MKNILYIIIWLISNISTSFADSGILWSSITESEIRKWEIHTDDIPNIITWATNFLLWISWTIAIIFVIIWAYKILLWSIEQDKTKWKDTIIMALTWFAIAALSWFIIKLIIDNFS